jgi:uncharacterized metal-binding protein
MIDLYLKSVCRGWHGYLGYVLAATLAVATFFSFGFLLFHPDLDAQPLRTDEVRERLRLVGLPFP